jgi:hypothetical protein
MSPCSVDGRQQKGGDSVGMTWWIFVGVAVWFLLSCVIGLVVGAAIHAADVEDVRACLRDQEDDCEDVSSATVDESSRGSSRRNGRRTVVDGARPRRGFRIRRSMTTVTTAASRR